MGSSYLLMWPSRRSTVLIWDRRSPSIVAGVYEAADDGTLTGVDGG